MDDQLKQLDERLTNVERVVLEIQASMTPKWLRVSTWVAVLAAVLRAVFEG